MEWVKCAVCTTTVGAEMVFGVLLSCDVAGAEIIDPAEMQRFLAENPLQWDYVDDTLTQPCDEDVWVVFYVSASAEGACRLETIARDLQNLRESPSTFTDLPLGPLSLVCEKVDDESWLHVWKKYYKPFRVGQSVVVQPHWEVFTKQAGDVVFKINPGSVFGTGLHVTTQICIEMLEQQVCVGDRVLDIGCGSGILFLIALQLGASFAYACDFDPAAAVTVDENAALNHIAASRYQMRTGNIFTENTLQAELSGKTFDKVIANITADAIIALASSVGAYLASDGIFIVSGIIAARRDDVVTALSAQGFRLQAASARDGWVGMTWRAGGGGDANCQNIL